MDTTDSLPRDAQSLQVLAARSMFDLLTNPTGTFVVSRIPQRDYALKGRS